MRKLFIHIGTEKTGTTTLQKFLLLNRELLKENNFYVPQIYYYGLNHRYITAICQKQMDDFFSKLNIFDAKKRNVLVNDLKAKFNEEFKNLDKNMNVIISSEHLHSRYKTVEEIECIKNLFKDLFDEINIIVYLRNQPDMLQSYYSTFLKEGSFISSFEKFIEKELITNRFYYDYYNLLSLWSSVFDKKNIKVRIFDKKEFIDNNLINDFLYTISPLLYKNIKDKYETPPYLNESINNEGEKLLKIVNKHLPSVIKKEGVNFLSRKLRNKISTNCKGKLKLLSKNIAEYIIEEFKESNEKVRKEIFPDREKLFNIDLNKYKRVEVKIPSCVLSSFEDTIIELKNLQEETKELFNDVKHKKVFFLDGWYNKEKWGIWAKGDETSKLLILIPKSFYEFSNFININFKFKKVKGEFKSYLIFNDKEMNIEKNNYTLKLSKKELEKMGGAVFIEFKHENAKSPKELGINEDTRILGVGIEDISFEKVV